MRGLSDNEVISLQRQYGKNIYRYKKEYRILRITWEVIREPMFIMLVIACSLYFILDETSEGVMMGFAMAIVTSISLYQEAKSSRAIQALKKLTEPKITAIRNNKETIISKEDLVPGDIILLEEGMKVPADAELLQQNDLSVDESVVTGESAPVEKNGLPDQNILYQGTMINSGKCIARITATGNQTFLGKIGKSIAGYSYPKTMLQKQVNSFVRNLATFGLIAFLIIFAINYIKYSEFATSLLFALTLAMSVVPEEIPVAFSSFMALGAYKVSRKNIVIRQPQVIENLGAINVLCLDKTGTITENKMEVKSLYSYHDNVTVDMVTGWQQTSSFKRILLYATLASESNPFDSMEKAILEAYHKFAGNGHPYKMNMIHEYPLQGQPPMMTHVYRHDREIIVAAKGAAERILEVCRLTTGEKQKVINQVNQMASKGFRVLGIASSSYRYPNPDLPVNQDNFEWQFEGLISLYDPPKKNIADVIRLIYRENVDVKLLTGDYPETSATIAQMAGILDPLQVCTGMEIMSLPDEALLVKVRDIHVFVRMYPDAKLRVINAIKANGDIVAMTGDGVNDGPALKAADIGIAMGKKGTQIARLAADIVLTDDDLSKIPIAIAEGRKIYNNLLKAIRYIVAIHIPIILTASVPVILGWTYPNIFTPIHVIFLELIMGPTCSIFFEKEPIEETELLRSTHYRKKGLFSRNDLLMSVLQGILIALGVLTLYYVYMKNGYKVEVVRTVAFTTLIICNVLLTFTSRSFTKTIIHTIRYKNPLAPAVLVVSAVYLSLLYSVSQVQVMFKLAPITIPDFLLCTGVALASVMWFEVYKMQRHKNRQNQRADNRQVA